MEAWIRFPTFDVASYLVFAAVLYFVLRRRDHAPSPPRILGIGLIVVIGGMVFA